MSTTNTVANTGKMPFTATLYRYVSEAQIETARAAQKRGGNRCAGCAVYGAKGFIENAGQWIRCFECNKTT